MKIGDIHSVTRLASVRENIIERRQLIADGQVRASVGGAGYWKPAPLVLAAMVVAENEALAEVETELRLLGVTVNADQPAEA